MHPHRRRPPPTTLRTLTIDSAAAMVPESVVLIRRFLLFVAVCLSGLLLYNDSNALRFLPRFSSSPSVLFSAYNSALAPEPFGDHCLGSKAFQRCLELHTHCFALITQGVDFRREAYFMTPHYLKMMWARIDFLRSVLEMGYNFVFTDADVMWFRDPFPQFYMDADFQIACDHFLGNSDDLENRPNGGFNYVKSNNSKLLDLRIMLQNWKQFMSLRPNLKKYLILPWGVPQNCSLDSLRRYDAPESKSA
ncbi:uncharacterized protein Pyn_27256 [Prunus yedoensis var. nudiflora]|uniref:Nucleotide-diphospho-sugar transferase domain-containing protein n=1 Tax=Prunus yedoensis var. nudiflora TaxID=2094558 RepID=A0A314Z198_PRUYE|nr:uncharacterized protein Pyn_27256 [Prunus yedoensis var. nudiflora]